MSAHILDQQSDNNLDRIGETLITVKSLHCKYRWKIKNFSSYIRKDLIYRSQYFAMSDSRLFLTCCPCYETNSSEYVSLYLNRYSSIYPIAANISIGIKTINNILLNEKKKTHTFTSDSPSCGWPTFIDKSKLRSRKSELMPSDIITIVCSVEIKTTLSVNAISGYGPLSEDFKKLFISKQNSDVTLNVKNKTFLAHKSILGARSPVLAAMFTNEMTEKKTGIVNIPDCDPDAFDIFLIFLYSGSVDFSKCNVGELYEIADKYDMAELKIMCAEFMISKLSVNNFCETFILGYQFNDKRLLTGAQLFFDVNYKEIFSSENWELLLEHNFRLANHLLKAMAPKIRIESNNFE